MPASAKKKLRSRGSILAFTPRKGRRSSKGHVDTEDQTPGRNETIISSIFSKLELDSNGPVAPDSSTGCQMQDQEKENEFLDRRKRHMSWSSVDKTHTPCKTASIMTDSLVLNKNTTPSRSSAKYVEPSSAIIPFGSLHQYNKKFVLRTCEDEPSMFQMDLPDAEAMLTGARICSVMNDYSTIDRNFNFSVLQGIPRDELEQTFSHNSCGTPNFGGGSHRKIVLSLLQCADDLVVEGFFREVVERTKVEATVFSSLKYRQLIVCYRGSDELQSKPVKKSAEQREEGGGVSYLHPKHKVSVHPFFRDAYFINSLEENIFALLYRLSDKNPFCDLVMTGYSFGATLATIGATRYASLRPMIRVSCHAFGSPRIGGKEFRELAHSLPNLKVVRIECGSDPYVSMPEGAEWLHVGHTITISKEENESGEKSSPFDIHAYRFDKRRPSSHSWVGMNPKYRTGQSKNDHDISSYVDVLEGINRLLLKWVDKFVGEEGEGISGLNNECRYVV